MYISTLLLLLFSHENLQELLFGGFTPSEKYESQLGWWHSQYMEKYNMFQTTNQIIINWLCVHSCSIERSNSTELNRNLKKMWHTKSHCLQLHLHRQIAEFIIGRPPHPHHKDISSSGLHIFLYLDSQFTYQENDLKVCRNLNKPLHVFFTYVCVN